jgi:hypothetical protein
MGLIIGPRFNYLPLKVGRVDLARYTFKAVIPIVFPASMSGQECGVHSQFTQIGYGSLGRSPSLEPRCGGSFANMVLIFHHSE